MSNAPFGNAFRSFLSRLNTPVPAEKEAAPAEEASASAPGQNQAAPAQAAQPATQPVPQQAPAATPAVQSDLLTHVRQRMFSILRAEMNLAEVEWDADGDLRFRYEERTYFVQFDPKDPLFVQFLLFLSYDGVSPEDTERVTRGTAAVNGSVKLAKCSTHFHEQELRVRMSAEVILQDWHTVNRDYTRRMLNLLRVARDEFVRAVFPQ